jgi:p-hydroxybenzoate 3-monooxygenase
MFERWGLADKLLAGPVAHTIDYRVNGVGRIFETVGDGGSQGRFCTQQMLVSNLLRELVDVMAGDIRFGVADVTIHNEAGQSPRVGYCDAGGSHDLVCDYIVGPDGVLTRYSHEFGFAQLPRGPHRSRYYLQCALADGLSDWPDDRIWDEIRLRLGDDTITKAQVHDKDFVPLRSVVHAPMQYRHLFLAGHAAHLSPPTGAKGMNLALYDVDVLAQALLGAVRDHDKTALNDYSKTVLPHIWKYQEFSVWMTDTMHDAGDSARHGSFRQMTARARLDNLFTSPTAGRLHSEYQRGTN